MKIRLYDDLGQLGPANAELASATIPAGTTAVLVSYYNTEAAMFQGLLTALNRMIDSAVADYPPTDVQTATAAQATASNTLTTTAQAYRAVLDLVAD